MADTKELGRFGGLLATIAVMLGVLTWASETGRSGPLVSMATTLVLLGAVYAVGRKARETSSPKAPRSPSSADTELIWAAAFPAPF